MASSFLKNFSINFTATVPPPNWQGSRKRVTSFRAATRMPERKNDYLPGGCLGSYKEPMSGQFQSAYDICAAHVRNVWVSRIQFNNSPAKYRGGHGWPRPSARKIASTMLKAP